MKKRLFLILIVVLCSLPAITSAQQVKIKHFGSIYTDADGVALKEPSGVSYRRPLLLVADSGTKSVLTYRYEEGGIMPVARISLPDMFPLQVQQAANEDIYVLDGRAREIVMLGPDGRKKGVFEPKGLTDGGKVVPRNFRIYDDGTVLVLDIFSERVLLLDPAGDVQRQVAFPEPHGSFADAIRDAKGNLYLLDSVEAVIYKAAAGAETFEALTPSMKDNMNFPTSLATDNKGTLFLVDEHGSGLAIVGADGSFAGRKLSMGWSESHLYYPNHISISDKGDIFIADKGNNRIQHFLLEE